MRVLPVWVAVVTCAAAFLRGNDDDDDEPQLDLDTGFAPRFYGCALHEVKYYFLEFVAGRQACKETCLSAGAYAFYDVGEWSEFVEAAGDGSPCATLGYTLFYKTDVTAHISVALQFDTYFFE